MIGARTRVFAVLGHPVAHSRSPELHGPWLIEHGIDAVYVALQVDPDRFDDVGRAVRTLGLAGINLTAPLKERVLPALDEIDAVASRIGAVNTVVRQGPRLVGHNTDAEGFRRALRDATGSDGAGRSALVLGAGGAGRAVADALVQDGARVMVLNRTPQRAQAVAARLAGTGPGAIAAGPLDPATFARAAASADLVVDALASGSGTVAGLDLDAVRPDTVWADLSYAAALAPNLQQRVTNGLRFFGGLGMLVHQGALAFRWFTGIEVDPIPALARLERAGHPEGSRHGRPDAGRG